MWAVFPKRTNSAAFSPYNYTDRTTADCRRTKCQLLRLEACHVVSAMGPHGLNFGFLDWSRYFFIEIAPQLSSRGWVNSVPEPQLVRKCSAEPGTSEFVASNSDHYITEAVDVFLKATISKQFQRSGNHIRVNACWQLRTTMPWTLSSLATTYYRQALVKPVRYAVSAINLSSATRIPNSHSQ
jgi:hypothetical protein